MPMSSAFSAALHNWVDVFMYRAMRDLLRFLRARGLSLSHYALLMRLHKDGPCVVSDVAKMLSVSKPAATQIVAHFVAEGWVTRIERVEDRRYMTVSLTASGRALTQECIDVRHRWLDDLPPLSAADQATIIKGFQALTSAVTRFQAATTSPGGKRS
jgi:DNA-binding MarR family transcriptional regulator